MNFISKIYKKFSIVYKIIFSNYESSEKEKDETTQSAQKTPFVLFKVMDNKQISIILDMPNISSDYDCNNMINDSENYANFLVHITHGLMYEDILNLVKKKLYETDDMTNKLFLENVLYFFSAIENDLMRVSADQKSSKTPLIRPLEVFSVTRT
jgi:hypothetical protein